MVALKFFKVEELPEIGDALPNAVYLVKDPDSNQVTTYYTDNTAAAFNRSVPADLSLFLFHSDEDLENLPTVNLPASTVAIVCKPADDGDSGSFMPYKLIIGPGFKSLPYIILPDDYHAVDNAKHWYLQSTRSFTPGSYPNDAVAAADGVPLGFQYHTEGAVKVRLT
jgi:hypothetical protein